MKRIAYICSDPGVPVFGTKGCSVHVQEGMRALRAQGAQITLFAQRIGGDAPADLADIKCIRLPKLSKVTVAERERSALAANQILERLLEKEGPFDAVYERYSLWGYAGMEYARDKDLPGILEVNAPLIEEQLQHRMLIHQEEAGRVVHRVTSAATALIAVSAAVGAYLGGFPEAAGKIHVIPNGVDPNRFSPEVFPSMPSAEDAFTVGFVGTLKPWHGVLDLVEAFAMLHKQAPNSRLLIVGDGPEREMIDARLAAHGLNLATHFTGAVHPADVPGLIASMDVGVAPYPIMENCYFSPLKAFEYMASGIAFVGSNIGQLGELVAHGKTGLLYAPGNTGELGKCLLSLYKDRRLVEQLGRTARKAILQSHTWDAVGARIMQMARQHHAARHHAAQHHATQDLSRQHSLYEVV